MSVKDTEWKDRAQILAFKSGLTPDQISDLLSVSPRTIVQWMRRGQMLMKYYHKDSRIDKTQLNFKDWSAE